MGQDKLDALSDGQRTGRIASKQYGVDSAVRRAVHLGGHLAVRIARISTTDRE
jgi:hypothetical protein